MKGPLSRIAAKSLATIRRAEKREAPKPLTLRDLDDLEERLLKQIKLSDARVKRQAGKGFGSNLHTSVTEILHRTRRIQDEVRAVTVRQNGALAIPGITRSDLMNARNCIIKLSATNTQLLAQMDELQLVKLSPVDRADLEAAQEKKREEALPQLVKELSYLEKLLKPSVAA